MNKSVMQILLTVLIVLLFISFLAPMFMPGHYVDGPFSFWENFSGPGHFWGGGMFIFPLIMLIVMLTFIYLVFGKGDFRPPWQDSGHTHNPAQSSISALDILKTRYAKGEISKDEFDQMKKDLD